MNTPIRILDLDLDLFQKSLPDFRSKDRQEESQEPWSKMEVRKFLERRCGLSLTKRTPGSFLTTHDEVFKHWRRLTQASALAPPFEIVHADAHADLGMGDASASYILGELLHKPVEERWNPKEGNPYGLTEGNFLSFALACRWISKLTYLYHPKRPMYQGQDDLPDSLMKGYDFRNGFIQLGKYDPAEIKSMRARECKLLAVEPEVPLVLSLPDTFTDAGPPFSLVCLTHSPAYTSSDTDALIPVIRQYIDER